MISDLNLVWNNLVRFGSIILESDRKALSLNAATNSAIKFRHNLCKLTCVHLTLHNEAEYNQARLDD